MAFLFVDDGSRDGTRARLDELATAAGGPTAVLAHATNRGKAEAVRSGIRHALAAGRPAVVGYWDADLSTPLAAIDDLLGVLGDDPRLLYVLGSRVKLLGRDIERRALRHSVGRVFATLASIVLRLPVYDTQCGAKLFRVTPELERAIERPFATRWSFDVELIARLIDEHGDRRLVARSMQEYPLRRWRHVAGSKVGPLDFLRALGELYRIARRHAGGSASGRPS